MAMLIENTFSTYKLTNEEELSGHILNFNQVAVLQNERAQVAESRLNVDFDPQNSVKFAQDEAFLKGQLSVYNLLLERSKVAQQINQEKS